jgi:hypothetical protein
MNHKHWRVVIATSVALLALGAVVVVAEEPGPEDGGRAQGFAAAGTPTRSEDLNTPVQFDTIITVTSSADPDDNGGRICYRNDIPTKIPVAPCTLRRALVEASALSQVEPSAEPILIKFNIPLADDGYDNALEVWTIELFDTPDLYALPRMEGDQITVDGDTQGEIGGRTSGPKIIIRGPDGSQNGMPVDGDDNTIRGLAFQTLRTYLYLNGDGNLVEDNWFGLADNGQDIHLRNETNPEDGSGYTGVDFAGGLSGAMDNTVQNNVFAGFTGVAAAIKGRENAFSGNYVGTVADGTVPLQGPFEQHPCLDDVWLGGSGISVADRDHQIGGPSESDGNVFAGLYLELFEMSTQPPAVRVGSGQGHLIQNNVIGLDGNDDVIGVCGRGLEFATGPEAMDVISNTIVESNLSAVVMNHWTLNGNTLRGNVIKREGAWPAEQGDNTFPEDAIAYGEQVPDALKAFEPAVVRSIQGTTVKGVSGDSENHQVCDNCVIEVFLEDTDTVTEALQSLAVVTADASGHWTATLPAALGNDQRVRTMSTVPDNWTIDDLDGGTTSNLSPLYPLFEVFLPVVLKTF